MRVALVSLVLLVACGGEESSSEEEFTTELGLKVFDLSDEASFTGADVDAAIVATTAEPVGKTHADPGTQVALETLTEHELPEVHFVDDPGELCGVVETHGCYLFAEGKRSKIVVEVLTDDEIHWTSSRDCIAVRTRIAHFAAHYAQEAMGLAIAHDVPLLGTTGENLDYIAQRHLYNDRCR